jgi:hypothetical protein
MSALTGSGEPLPCRADVRALITNTLRFERIASPLWHRGQRIRITAGAYAWVHSERSIWSGPGKAIIPQVIATIAAL